MATVVSQVTTNAGAAALAVFARNKLTPHLSTWGCSAPPFKLEADMRTARADPGMVLLVCKRDGVTIGYTIVRKSDQFCAEFIPDPAYAVEAFTALVEECCKRFPNMWGYAQPSEYRLFLSVKASRKVVFEPPCTYRIVDP